MTMNIKIGCSGFPVRLKEYLDFLDLVEVDGTFHSIPAISTARRWRRLAPRNFEFSVTASSVITHGAAGGDGVSFAREVGVLEAWKKTKGVAKALEAKVILFRTPPSFGPDTAGRENMKRFFTSIERDGFDMVWQIEGAWPEKEIKAVCGELDLSHCADPFAGPVQHGRIRYFKLGERDTPHRRYTGIDLKRLKDLCEDESSRTDVGRIYAVFNNTDMMRDARRFDWIMKNTGRIKEINLSFLRGLCGEIESREEDANIRRLTSEAERIVILILHTDYARVDIEIEKSKLRELCRELFPGKEYLYEMIYARRFDRLWEQFRGDREE
jgi:uncharacterized protein YecE (DUF72 family)